VPRKICERTARAEATQSAMPQYDSGGASQEDAPRRTKLTISPYHNSNQWSDRR